MPSRSTEKSWPHFRPPAIDFCLYRREAAAAVYMGVIGLVRRVGHVNLTRWRLFYRGSLSSSSSARLAMMANVRAERLLKIPAEPSAELRIPGAAAQTRVVSKAGIRLGSWESARARLVSPAQASLPRSWPTPELRIPNAAAQTRIVSKARIRLNSR